MSKIGEFKIPTDLTLINMKDRFLENAGDRPPLGIMYVASFLDTKFGYNTRIIDMNHEELPEKIESKYVGISFPSTLYYDAHKLAKELKEKGHHTIAGGAHCNAWYGKPDEPVNFKYFDQAVIGDGEVPMLNIMRGSEYKKYYGKRLHNLDCFPTPARDKVDMSKYELGTLVSSRGCFGSCIFCSSPGRGVGYHSPERVTFEMQDMIDKYGYKELYFHDDTFTTDYTRVEHICKMIKDKGIKAKSRINARADTVDANLLNKMSEAGVDKISFGFEHADDNVLRKSGKGMIKVADYERVIKQCHDNDIEVYGYFILNLPGATEETARKTIQWSKDVGIDHPSYYPLIAFPGTAIWDHGKELGLNVIKNYGFFQAGKEGPRMNVENPKFPNNRVRALLREIK